MLKFQSAIGGAKSFAVVALAAYAMGAAAANAALVTTFSSLGSPTILPPGATSVVDFGALTAGLPYNGGAIYNTGGGFAVGITNPSSFVAAPWTSIPVAFPPGSGYPGNFFADNIGDSSTWTFAAGQHTFYLYIGSLDFGNSLTIAASNGTTVFEGSAWTSISGVAEPGDGLATIRASDSNGWFRFTDTGGTSRALPRPRSARITSTPSKWRDRGVASGSRALDLGNDGPRLRPAWLCRVPPDEIAGDHLIAYKKRTIDRPPEVGCVKT